MVHLLDKSWNHFLDDIMGWSAYLQEPALEAVEPQYAR